MKKKYLLLLLGTLGFVCYGYAQQLKVNKTLACYGSISYFNIPPFILPASTNIEFYTFYIGGDTIVTTENEQTAMFEPGTHAVSADIRLSDGSTVSTNSVSVQIAAPPIDSFSINGNTFCTSAQICLTNTSVPTTFPLSGMVIWYGDGFLDSLPANTVSKCRQFHLDGIFSIGIRLFDSLGCRADTSFQVTIKQHPKVSIDWSGTISCSGSPYTFASRINGGISSPNTIQSYTWDFGDGQTYSATRPFTPEQLSHIDTITHFYTTDGIFTPSVSITDTNGCAVVQSKIYANPGSLPTNIASDGKIRSSFVSMGPDEQVVCHSPYSTLFFQPPLSQFDFTQNWNGGSVWNFDDPASMQQNFDYSATPMHLFAEQGRHIVKLDLSNAYPNCVFYDTIDVVGPTAKIENINLGITIAPAHKYQTIGTDTVDFVNTTLTYNVTNKIRFAWDFDDQYAPACTAYTVPKPGALLPFATAKDQYDNSDHYYISNGVTHSGKMNCRWSLDSLPCHVYTNWDSVYSWYLHGKTFPAGWGVNPIQPNSNIHFLQVLDPFMLARGKIVLLPGGNLSSPTGFYSYTGPDGTIVTHNGMDILPNSTRTFYEYLFYNGIARNYRPTLAAFDSLGTGCLSFDHVILKFGRPDAHRTSISAKNCPGRPDGYASIDLGNLNNTMVLINFDSLADRKDATPCTIDGFVDFQGGITPGGLIRPPFFSGPNFMPATVWHDGSGTTVSYHYGPNAPGNNPAPADSVNGFVTIGVIIGSGCANPPFCTQPESYSDTLWFHNAIQAIRPDPQFTLAGEGKLFSKKETITVKPLRSYQPDIKYDTWAWNDGTVTVDSFWYAAAQGLPANITNGYFTKGVRRVRYEFSNQQDTLILSDSLLFPNGYPGIRIKTDSVTNSQCTGNPVTELIVEDSALLLLPLTHLLQQSSFETSVDPANPQIGMITHLTGSTQGCTVVAGNLITTGIIDSIVLVGNTSTICAGASVNLQGFARYFRCDNVNTSLPFLPNHSCATHTYYLPPYDALNFDTLDFWRVYKNQNAGIRYTYLNTLTGKTDTVYYEKMFWDFGDGSPIVKGTAANHQYTSSGMFTIKMITRDSVGGWDTCTKDIVVSEPVAKIGSTKPSSSPDYGTILSCVEDLVLIDSSYTAGNSQDSITSNFWWFGDNRDSIDWQFRNKKQVTHHYKANGSFNVKLVIETGLGCRDTAYSKVFTTGPRPYFRMISGTTGCAPLTIRLVNDADSKRKFVSGGGTFPNDTPTACTYVDMGDGISPQIIVLRHDTVEYTYTTAGQFHILAFGSDAPAGLINTCPLITFPDGVMDTPVVVTVYDNTTNGIVGKRKVNLSETTKYSVSRTTNASYSWSITGGIISGNPASPTVSVAWSATAGNYTLVCTKTISGCSTSDTLQVTVGTPTTTTGRIPLSQHTISVFPNPARTNVTIKLNTVVENKMSVTLYDVVGKNHFSETFEPGKPTERIFDIQSLKPGIYFIEVRSENERYVHKLLIE